MMIYPTLEVQRGRCVSLHRGRLEAPRAWPGDPVETACRFAAAGASWLHVTDLDAVERAETTNAALLREIIRAVRIPVQVAGGMGTMDRIAEWLDAGAGRVVIGTTAVADPGFVHRAARRWPDAVVLAVDVMGGRVMAGGWRTKTAFAPVDFVGWFAADPLAAVVVTDIDADIDAADASLSRVTAVAGAATQPVIARGTIRGLDDISRLKYVPRVHGTMIGRALMDGSVDLGRALAVAESPREAVAPFL